MPRMAMGRRKRERQPTMWVTTTDLPTAASHPFYTRLNQLLREHGFDDSVEALWAGFYASPRGSVYRRCDWSRATVVTNSATCRGRPVLRKLGLMAVGAAKERSARSV
jgi:hypothetical protein